MQQIWELEVIMLRMFSGKPSVYHHHHTKYSSSVKDYNISTDSPCHIADCIVDVDTIFRRKFNMVNIIICGLIPCDEYGAMA